MIYLDHNATTPLDERVLQTMLPYYREQFGNAASVQHEAGRRAAVAVERAAEQLAAALGGDPREIFWTSGATEADNLALFGVAAAPNYVERRRIVTVATEHKAVLEPCEELARRGWETVVLPVDRDGLIDLERLEALVDDDTLVVSVMLANNETGVLQPLREIGALCHERGVLLHTDATQALGRVAIDVQELQVDLLSVSAHKVYGPQGTGALWVRRKGPRARCAPLLLGGGHQRGMRPGTLNVPGIVGFGAAAELAEELREEEQARCRRLRDRLCEQLMKAFPGLQVHGAGAPRLDNTLSASLPGVDADRLMAQLPDVALASSAACTSALRQPSYVLAAMGVGRDDIRGSLRFSLGRGTTESEIDAVVDGIRRAVG